VKVALVCEWLDPWRGGAETSTQQFIHHLIDLGVELELYTRSHIPSRPRMSVHRIPATGPSRAMKTFSFCRRAEESLRAGRCDLVHAITPSLVADIYQPRGGTYAETILRNMALRQNLPAKVLRGLTQRLNLRQRLLLSYERRMLHNPEPPVVIALSDYVVHQLREHYGFPPERIRKVFNGVEPDHTDAATRAENRRQVRLLYDIDESDLLVLMVAHNFKLKGVRAWIDALSILLSDADQPIKSLVVGRSRVLPWQRLAERKKVAGALHFPGPTPRVRAFYHAADILVHPTFYDPCSRVVLEAMVSGLPCVTTRHDGASEVIEPSVNGFVLEAPTDVTGLVNAVRCLADAEVRRRIAAAAGNIARSVSMRRHAEEIVGIYNSMSGGAGRL
jgi:UDP-glucose:(heptosyl)LPS alpha-1,3-glucosyltransferase